MKKTNLSAPAPPNLAIIDCECRIVRRRSETRALERLRCELVRRPGQSRSDARSSSFAETLMLADSDGVRPRLTTLDLVSEYCHRRFGSLVQEGFWVVCLDGAQAPIQIFQVSLGTGNLQALSPADVLRPVLLSGSTSYLVVHNHPSGTAEPSADDWVSTQVLVTLSTSLCLELVDHVIVTQADWQGLRQIDTRGIWPKGKTVLPRKPEPSRRASGSLRVG